MRHFIPPGLGWQPSLPDYRDYELITPTIRDVLSTLTPSGPLPPQVDLREYFVEVDDQLELPTSSAQACVGLVQYFVRRAFGKLIRPARLFVHQNARRLALQPTESPDLRTTLQAVLRFGIPPERLWPYDPTRLAEQPDAALYAFAEPLADCLYVRLDTRHSTGRDTARRLRACLAAGFPACFGMPIPNSLTTDGIFSFRPTFDAPLGGQALVLAGYDDRWLRGSRGAFLVRSSWGPGWGEAGYGWLPYAFVEERLAVDFFTLVSPRWVATGEFTAPDLGI